MADNGIERDSILRASRGAPASRSLKLRGRKRLLICAAHELNAQGELIDVREAPKRAFTRMPCYSII